LADRLRGEGEPSDGVEEGIILEKCQKTKLFVCDNQKMCNFAFCKKQN
jgi:hypothetical protein